MVEQHFTHAHALWSNLHIFVFLYVFESFLERENNRRNDSRFLVCAARTHVCELFGFGNVHHKIVLVNVFSHNLAGVNLFARIYEELATVLKVVNGVSKGCARFQSHQPFVRLVISPL